MTEINEFLNARPLISVNRLEAKLSIPLGTIRVSTNKQIPNKYIDAIISELSNYGYVNKSSQTSDNPVIAQSTDYFIKENSIFYKDNGLNRRASFPNGTRVVILPQS